MINAAQANDNEGEMSEADTKYEQMSAKIAHNKNHLLQKAVIFVSLWYYIYLYFYPFDQGVSDAPVLFGYLKYVIWFALFSVSIFFARFRITRLLSEYIIFFTFLLLLQLIHLPQYSQYTDASGLFLGSFLVFVPVIFLLSWDVAASVMRFIPIIMGAQVILGIAVALMGIALWANDAFVGALGTHVAFGLLLNIAIIKYLCSHPRLEMREITFLALLFIGLVYSKSLSELFVCFLCINFFLLTQGKKHLAKFLLLTISFILIIIFAWNTGIISNYVVGSAIVVLRHFTGSQDLLSGLVSNVPQQLSRSVYLRQDIYQFGWKFLTEGKADNLLFGDFSNTIYHSFDSQYLMIFVNYGLIALILFMYLLVRTGLVAIRIYRLHSDIFPFLSFVIFSISFLFSRHLYYFPINILFFLFIVYISDYFHKQQEHANSNISINMASL